jgi:hypothetical protein
MTNLLDYLLDLFRDPVRGEEFVKDPDRAMANAGLQNVTAAQVQAFAATAAPSLALGGGDPVCGLQEAVAESHGIPFVPQETFTQVRETDADVLSHNDTRILSPETNIHDDHSVNLDFGDITFGDKTTADHGGVAVGGNNSGDILTDGSVKQTGIGNTAITGDIHSGRHSPVIIGTGNDVHDNSQTGGGDIIDGNQGTVIKDNDLGGGNAPAGGGSITVDDNHSTNTGGGDVTNVNTGGGVHGNIDASHHDDNSVHVDNSTHDDHSTHTVDNSVHQGIHQGVDAHLF